MISNFNCSYMARSSLAYIPFLAHLAFRPCELLPSLFVHLPSVNISHCNLLLRNHCANCNQTMVECPWEASFQNCIRWSRLPTKMAAKPKIEKRGMKLKKNFSSETTEPFSTKLCWNDPWVVPFQNCVMHFRPPIKMVATAELNLSWDPMGNSHKNLLVWNHLLNKN